MKPLYIILDNGHGTREYTKGKCAPDKSLYEGEWNRSFVQRLSNFLKTKNIEHYILVPENKDISLRERVRRANDIYAKKKADYEVMLISVHINAAKSDMKWHDASGFTVWISSNAGDKSKKIGYTIGKAATDLKLRGNRYVPAGEAHVKGFTIIHDTKCPAILCEHLFMDNIEDLKTLKSEEGCQRLMKIYENTIPSLEL